MGKKRLKKKTLTISEICSEIEQIIKIKYRSLKLVSDDDKLRLKGIFPIIDPENGSEIDRYKIEIEFHPDYPVNMPILRETQGRIPRTIDRHIVGDDGRACLFVREEGYRRLSQNPSIISFIEGPVYQFLLSQSYYELTGDWLFGEWAHGPAGVFEFYSEILETEDPKIILTFVKYLSNKEIRNYWRCYCGSGRKLKKCHLTFMYKIRNQIPSFIADDTYKYILSHLKSNKTN
ncbi:MAG TPA: SEC-C domain-containing protein [Thermodesulfobacteriota bacterium]|nr:SEC-C domain-containing protein [Thermodesulfobacteriota bacterium]